jgi:hypothetical protein
MGEAVEPQVGQTYKNTGPTGQFRERHNLKPILFTVTSIDAGDRQDRHVRGSVQAEDGTLNGPYATSFHVFAMHWRPID